MCAALLEPPDGPPSAVTVPEVVQATFCATLVDEWVRGGVTDAVVCPGSRSTPMALALAADGRVRVHVVLDERVGAFLALGLGRATGRPAVVLTTSGTAAVHLHAAVVEADLDLVPLLACTADRPPELRDVGAPQTIDQARLYGAAPRWFHDPGPPDATTRATWRSLAARAVSEAVSSRRGPGPVHLNLPFREPLVAAPGPLPLGRSEGRPWHATPAGATSAVAAAPSGAVVDTVAHALAGRRGVLVAGEGAGDPVAVHALAEALGWPVLADPRSGCRVPAPTTVAAADAVLRVPAAAVALRPEVALRLGAPWASKVVAQWLAGVPDDLLVDPFGRWRDPARTAGAVIDADPTELCRALVDRGVPGAPEGWLATWRAAEAAAQSALGDAVAAGGLTEPAVARLLVDTLPSGAALVVSSSMPVRDVEWYGGARTGLRVHANRGANGIDGVVSTVLGVAAGHDGPTVGLLGDLALLHDAGGLVAGAGLGIDATLVVVDNGGGGIFEFLPQAGLLDRSRFERLFGTPQPVDLSVVATGCGVRVRAAGDPAELRDLVGDDLQRSGVGMVLVRTDRRANVAAHDAVHAAVAEAVGPLFA